MADTQTRAFEVAFAFEKETKHTVKYAEEPAPGQPPRIGSLYVQKWALGSQAPRRLHVTVAMSDQEGR